MLRPQKQDPHSVCPRTGKPIKRTTPRLRRRWMIWLYPLLGFVSLVWFLLRVVPKPSRATYPCQRAAAPLAASFITWLVGVLGSIVAFHRAQSLLRRSRYAVAAIAILVGCIGVYLAATNSPTESTLAYTYEPRDVKPNSPNSPMGVATGMYPGRVVWVHDPEATEWDPPDKYSDFDDSYWWEAGNTDPALVDSMMSKAIRWYTEESTDVAAWEKLFRHFNTSRGLADRNYQAGEKVAIKINLTVTNVDSAWTDASGNQTANLRYNSVSVEMAHALLDQLVNVAGVPQQDISIGDPTCVFPSREYYYLSADFPNVHYMTGRDGIEPLGRTRTASSSVKMEFSGPGTAGKIQDYLPKYYADAKYFINFAILKAHLGAVTLCGKNHYGSLNRRPPTNGYYNLHDSLTYMDQSYGSYRALVDLMGHEHIGGKTLLYIIDGLWGGYSWGGVCPPVKWRMAPFNGDHPNSIFISQDPVAIDSVGFDFLWEEDRVSWDYYPYNGYRDAYGTGYSSGRLHMSHLKGGVDYLVEAALADNPPSGTFYDPEGDGARLGSLGVYEHWNNGVDKQYSRNLGAGDGIELVTGPPPAEVAGRHIFYNNSEFDGNDPDPGPADDGAIAPDKEVLMPGGTASPANSTSFNKGVNGVMVDVANLKANPTLSDFDFRSGGGVTWNAVPSPTMTIRPGAGVGGSDRITFTWADGAITNCWLRVTMMSSIDTGLETNDLFYVGNAVGDASGDGDVDLDDFVLLKLSFGASGAGFVEADLNRDRDVDLDDFVILKQSWGTSVDFEDPT